MKVYLKNQFKNSQPKNNKIENKIHFTNTTFLQLQKLHL
jgi:hypothetical protein